MKFLEAKTIADAQGITAKNRHEYRGEHKMQAGIREDQKPEPRQHKPEVVTFAKELGVDLNKVIGTGKDGIVLVRDVRAAKELMEQENKLKSNG